MNIGKWALKNNKLIYFLVAILLVGGFLSYLQMSKLEDPAIKVRVAMVVTIYPGASSHEVELQATDKIEKAIFSMRGVDLVQSNSYADLSIISVQLNTTIPEDEIEQYWDMLRRKVNDVQRELPAGAQSSIVMDDYGDVFGMFYALTSDGIPNDELCDYAKMVQRKVENIEGISKVELYGEMQSTIDIAIDEDKLAHLGVTPLELLQNIQDHNKSVYSGYYISGAQRIRVNVGERSSNAEDLRNILIDGHQGDQFYLKEIATIEDNYADPTREALYYDMMPAIGISISALDGTDITKLGKEVEAKLAEVKAEGLPIGIEYNKVFFQPERVQEAIDSFFLNLIASVLIVIVVLMFTMGFRSGVLLGVVLVVTVLGSLFFLDMMEGTLQRVSLASFILAMGMLVDNAIVIVDGILIDKANKKLNSRALTDIGQKTAMPLLGATLIAILAFFPLFLSPDMTGVYIRDLFVVLAVSLLLSWILSLTMVPLLAKRLFKNLKAEATINNNTIFHRILRATLSWCLRNRIVTLGVAIVFVIGSIYLYFTLSQSFFPDMNYNQVYIEYNLPENNDSKQTKKDLDAITEHLLSLDAVTHVTASVGATPSRYNLVRSISTPSLAYGDLIVEFKDSESTVVSIDHIQKYLNENFPQAYARVKRYNLMYNKYPIEVTFKGPDPAVLRDLTAQAQAIMEASDKIVLVTSNWQQKVPTFELQYNQAVAKDIGLSRTDVGLSILASTDGIPAEVIYDGNNRRQIVMKCVDQNGDRINNLATAPVFSLIPSFNILNRETVTGLATGALTEEEVIASVVASTPLSQVINDIAIVWEEPVVVRHNGQRAMSAQGNNIASVGAEDARSEIAEAIEAIPLPDGYSMTWQGEVKAKSESMKYLFANVPIAIILMIVILIMLFKDYKKPMIILLSVPLLSVGAIIALWISGKAFGFVAIASILGLVGMMIKNGIVLMDEIELQIKGGKSQFDALIDSSSIRFRPVMMASLTTILGMIPLLSDDMFGACAATIMGGLLLGTVVTLIYIPVIYSLFFNTKSKQK